MILTKVNHLSKFSNKGLVNNVWQRQRGLATTKKYTAAEREELLKVANEKMKAYYTNRPPIEKIRQSKRNSNSVRDKEHYIQAVLVASFVATFVITPFLGKKIAQDDAFRNAVIPSWYDFSISSPKSAWTRAELHEQVTNIQHDLHERAIRGEFSPDKMDEMRRHFEGVDPDSDEHGWGKIHPGLDEDDDIEDD